jgi:hypothetical protein
MWCAGEMLSLVKMITPVSASLPLSGQPEIGGNTGSSVGLLLHRNVERINAFSNCRACGSDVMRARRALRATAPHFD